MAKASDVRPKITLACTVCKERNYITKKNRRNDPDRMELKKFCPRCRQHQPHRETRLLLLHPTTHPRTSGGSFVVGRGGRAATRDPVTTAPY